MVTLVHRLMHRCRDCGRHFTAVAGTLLELCLCGGIYAVDATFHPTIPGAFTFIRPENSPRCMKCGAMHLVENCTLVDIDDARAAADAARHPAPEPYGPTNGHAYGNIIGLGATGT